MLTRGKSGDRITSPLGKPGAAVCASKPPETFFKKEKKVLDKAGTKWYTVQAVCEERAAKNLEN